MKFGGVGGRGSRKALEQVLNDLYLAISNAQAASRNVAHDQNYHEGARTSAIDSKINLEARSGCFSGPALLDEKPGIQEQMSTFVLLSFRYWRARRLTSRSVGEENQSKVPFR